MTDYIKREDAISTMYTFLKQAHDMDNNNDRLAEVLTIAKNVVYEIPPADAAPVRHGRWIECTSSPHWKCSMCGTKAPIWFDEFNEICEWLSVYCPNCGAKMDEGGSNGTDNK